MNNKQHLELKAITAKAIKDIIKVLLSSDEMFSIVIDADKAEGINGLTGGTLFHITGYSKETFIMGEDTYSFSFGDNNNVEYTVKAAYEDIIVLAEAGVPYITNLHHTFTPEADLSWKDMEPGKQRSFNAFKSNPENSKFFNKTKVAQSDELEPIS
jgi:hypothetical protein